MHILLPATGRSVTGREGLAAVEARGTSKQPTTTTTNTNTNTPPAMGNGGCHQFCGRNLRQLSEHCEGTASGIRIEREHNLAIIVAATTASLFLTTNDNDNDTEETETQETETNHPRSLSMGACANRPRPGKGLALQDDGNNCSSNNSTSTVVANF